MLALSTRNQILIGTILVLLMMATRNAHFATLHNLPGASWAVFFLAGIYLKPRWVFPGLLALTWLLDFASFMWGNSSGFCLTRAYVFLVPAYGVLWGAGRWYARRLRVEWRTLLPLGAAMLAGVVACELLSSGGFYFFSGRFEPTFAEFGARLVRYFPASLQSLTFYVAIGVAVHTALAVIRGVLRHRDVTAG
jgi:hypothetical protein